MSTTAKVAMAQFGSGAMPRHVTRAVSSKIIAASQPRRAQGGLSYAVSPRLPEQGQLNPQPSPLSVLPASVLLRSLLVATVSSKPFLLRPSLAFLSRLTRFSGGPLSLLWSVDRNPLLRACLKNTFYKQFCAGESMPETRETLEQMKALGFRGTMLQYAKETSFDHKSKTAHGQGVMVSGVPNEEDPRQCKSIAAWRKGTLDTVELLAENDMLALKYVSTGFACHGLSSSSEMLTTN